MPHNNAIRVVHILGTGQIGGTFHSTLSLAQAQRDAGMKPEIWCALRSQLDSATRLCAEGGVRGLGLTRAQFVGRLARLRFAKPCIVHLHSGHPVPSRSESAVARFIGAHHTKVLSMHCSVESIEWTTKMRGRMLPTTQPFDAISAPCELDRRHWIENGLDSNFVTVLPSGVPRLTPVHGRLRERLGIAADHPIVAFCGRMVGGKGIHLLVDAFRIVLRDFPNAVLVAAGDGPMLKTLIEETRDLKESIRWLGHVDNVSDVYGDADCLVLPSRAESFGLSAHQGAEHRVPLILSPIHPWLDEFDHDTTCLFFETFDGPSIARQIKRYLLDPNLRTRIAQTCHQSVSARFSPAALASKVGALYAEAITRRGRHSG